MVYSSIGQKAKEGFVTYLTVFAFVLCSHAASASTILGPISASTNMGVDDPTFALVNSLNQNGLSDSYAGGVTDLDTFVSATTHTNSFNAINNIWLSTKGIATGYVDFELGDSQWIDAFVLWNYNNSSAIDQFRLTTKAGSVLGTFSAEQTSLRDQIGAQVFRFTPTFADSVHMEILSNNGSAWTAISEVAFGVTVPEPAALTLLGSFAFVLAGLFWRRKSNRVPRS